MLDNMTDFVKATHSSGRALADRMPAVIGEMYCPKCAGVRRMRCKPLYSDSISLFNPSSRPPDKAEFQKHIEPSLFQLLCVQCDTEFTVLIYKGVEGLAMGVFSNQAGGASTPHTPEPVAYYLDQAQRAQSVGANSAAVAMYRGALDQLLFHEGFSDGMLGNKLQALKNKIDARTAPKWAMELDTEYLSAFNQLGNGSIHPNDGDITKQQLLDNGILVQMREAFRGLLYLVFEVPHERQQLLGDLKSRAQLLKK